MSTLYIVEDRLQEKKYQLQLPWRRGAFLTNVLYAEYEGYTLEVRPVGREGVYRGNIGLTKAYADGDLRLIEEGLMAIADVLAIKRIRDDVKKKMWEMQKPDMSYGGMLYMSHFIGLGGVSAGFF